MCGVLEPRSTVLTCSLSGTVLSALSQCHKKQLHVVIAGIHGMSCPFINSPLESRPQLEGRVTAKRIAATSLRDAVAQVTLCTDAAVHFLAKKLNVSSVVVGADSIQGSL